MDKSPDAFRTISEAADELDLPQHVLRFWETRFSFIRPMKRAGGRRFYRPQDVSVLKGVKALLYTRGFKIEGVQRLYREQGLQHLVAAGGQDPEAIEFTGDDFHDPVSNTAGAAPISDAGRQRLHVALKSLETARSALDAVLRK